MDLDRLAFVDLETTGANPAHDRITEIGMVLVDGERVEHWSSLVNPGCPIPPFIQRLTGIDDAMVASAPTFAELAETVQARLAGRLFIAHNVRFDHGFLRAEFRRLNRLFRADRLCTVKLSRRLHPQYPRHNLDSLIERHDLTVGGDRHRALADAELLWQLWRRFRAEGPTTFLAAVGEQFQQPEWPPQLNAEALEDLPEGPGVYVLRDAAGAPLKVARADNLRRRLTALLGKPDDKGWRERVHGVEWRETLGEIGALLLERRWLADGLGGPVGQAVEPACSWRLHAQAPGDYRAELVHVDRALDDEPAVWRELHGLYPGRREARNALRKLAQAHQLCPVLLGLEEVATGQPCPWQRRGACRGACVGEEARAQHGVRLITALARQRLEPWPYPGAIGIVERDTFLGLEEVHVLKDWRYYGSARDAAELAALPTGRPPPFDAQLYKELLKLLRRKLEIRRLAGR